MRRTQFFEYFEYFSNTLIINALQTILPFLSPNTAQDSSTFKFLFRHTFKTTNYTFLNTLSEKHRFLPQKQEFFKFQRTENFKTARWKFKNTALFLKKQCAEIMKKQHSKYNEYE